MSYKVNSEYIQDIDKVVSKDFIFICHPVNLLN